MCAENSTWVRPASGRTIGIVGVGPRGLSAVERIVENARDHVDDPITVHLAERRRFGSGEVWRTDQSPLLLMNIVASQITAFTDETVSMVGPLRRGPNLHEWAMIVASGVITDAFSAEVLDEAVRTHANSYCTRSFYGHYLEWAYRRLVLGLPPGVRIVEHRGQVMSATDTANGDQLVTMDNGETFAVRHLILAVGHGTVELSDEEKRDRAFASRIGGDYYPPANPADVDTHAVRPGRPVLIRGLGLCFFDYMSLFTAGRGGEFVEKKDGLAYLPSGAEPRIVCGSRRGLPLHSRADNEKGDRRYEPMFLTEDAIELLRRRAGPGGLLDFRRDAWPLIAKEVETVYYTRLIADRDSEVDALEFGARYAKTAWSGDEERRVLRRFRVTEDQYWDWTRVGRPWSPRDIGTTEDWRRFLRPYLHADVREARRGNVSSPYKAAVDVLRDIRNEIRYVLNNGGVEAESYRRDVEGWFNSLHAFLSVGPPWRRIAELLALLDAGILDVAGPGFSVGIDEDTSSFVGTSLIPGEVNRGDVLIDAMLPKTDLTRTSNLVLSRLTERRQLTRFSVKSVTSADHPTGGVAVTERPFRAIRADGTVHPRRYVFGVPTEGANWVTETGIRPNVNSITLGDSDAIARSVLGLAPVSRAVVSAAR